MAKYALHPGHVFAKYDRDRHYISSAGLARLYGVPMSECIVWDRDANGIERNDLIHLYPSENGIYHLPVKR